MRPALRLTTTTSPLIHALANAMGNTSATGHYLLALTALLVPTMAALVQAAGPVTSGRSATKRTCLQSAENVTAIVIATARTARYVALRANAYQIPPALTVTARYALKLLAAVAIQVRPVIDQPLTKMVKLAAKVVKSW